MTSPVPPATDAEKVHMANFILSSNLSKPHEIPSWKKWRVCGADRLVEGPVLVYLRHKGWIFDRVSPLASRECVLTRRGYLLIYTREDKGFVLNMRSAKEVWTHSDTITAEGQEITRCRVKVRFPFGTVNVVLNGGKIDKWRGALVDAVENPINKAPVESSCLAGLTASTKPPLKQSEYGVKKSKTKTAPAPVVVEETVEAKEDVQEEEKLQLAVYKETSPSVDSGAFGAAEFSQRMFELSTRPAGTTFAMLDDEDQRFITALLLCHASMTNLYESTGSERSIIERPLLAITSSETMVEVPEDCGKVDGEADRADKTTWQQRHMDKRNTSF